MKKVLIALMALVMVCTLSFSAVAEGFLDSPSKNKAPVLISFSCEPECDNTLVITAYADRHDLEDEHQAQLEAAYQSILGVDGAVDFTAFLESIVDTLGVSAEDLAVSDLFDISFTCDEHNVHQKVTITIQPEVLNNFVALLHFNDGEWEVIKNTTVDEDNNTLTFSLHDFSPFAILVDTSEAEGPDTGVTSFVWAIAVLAVVAVGVILVVANKQKYGKQV